MKEPRIRLSHRPSMLCSAAAVHCVKPRSSVRWWRSVGSSAATRPTTTCWCARRTPLAASTDTDGLGAPVQARVEGRRAADADPRTDAPGDAGVQLDQTIGDKLPDLLAEFARTDGLFNPASAAIENAATYGIEVAFRSNRPRLPASRRVSGRGRLEDARGGA